MSNETSTMIQQSVIYKGVKCEIIYNYGNGNYEIVFGEQILLVRDSDIQIIN